METLKVLRVLGEAGRARVLRLLGQEELSVAELQEILGMGQSRISMQLSQLKNAGCVEVRRVGQKNLYRVADALQEPFFAELLQRSGDELPDATHDDEALRLVVTRRKDTLRGYFDELAGRFGRDYVPGRSWKALCEVMLRLLPPLTIADLGAGEGTLSLLLAQRAAKVIAVDNAPKMVEYGASLAARNNVTNLDYRLGDMECLPIGSGEVELALMHQSLHHALHPQEALNEAWRVLKPGGRIAILDLLKHDFEGAQELYGDMWPGFSQVELLELLRHAGFKDIEIAVVEREADAPHFSALMALAHKSE